MKKERRKHIAAVAFVLLLSLVLLYKGQSQGTSETVISKGQYRGSRRADGRSPQEVRAIFCREHIKEKGQRQSHQVLDILSLFDDSITFLDIGAHYGVLTLSAVYCYAPPHVVIAIEPVKHNFNMVLERAKQMGSDILASGRLHVANMAFSNKTEIGKMYVPMRRSDNAALSEAASTANVVRKKTREQEVAIQRGDEFLEKYQAVPRLVKVDVQGSEIQGMEKFLTSSSDMILIAEQDQNLMRNSGFDPLIVYDYMRAFNFSVYCKPNVSLTKGMRFHIEGEEYSRQSVTKNVCNDLTYWK